MRLFAYIDGACSHNGQPNARAASAAILVAKEAHVILKERIISCDVPGEQTNNRAEIFAAILALETLTRHKVIITIVTDSNYLYGTITQSWKRKTNHDLWARLDKVLKHHTVIWEKVHGHTDHEYNNKADKAAVAHSRRKC